MLWRPMSVKVVTFGSVPRTRIHDERPELPPELGDLPLVVLAYQSAASAIGPFVSVPAATNPRGDAATTDIRCAPRPPKTSASSGSRRQRSPLRETQTAASSSPPTVS